MDASTSWRRATHYASVGYYDRQKPDPVGATPGVEYRRLRPSFEQVALRVNEVLLSPGDTVKYVYFPDDAVVSLIFDADERRTVEFAMEGNEGAVGFTAYLGGTSSCDLAIVRDAGTAIRLDVNLLKRFASLDISPIKKAKPL